MGTIFAIMSLLLVSGSWTPVAPISTTSTPNENVYVAYDPATNQMFSAWNDAANLFSPTTSIYTQGTGWGPLLTILGQAGSDVSLGYNPSTEQMFAAWTDLAEPPTSPSAFSSIFSGSAWDPEIMIGGSSVPTPSLAYSVDLAEMFVGYSNLLGPTAAIFVSNVWNSMPIEMGSTRHNVNLAYDPTEMLMFAAWAEQPRFAGQPAIAITATYNPTIPGWNGTINILNSNVLGYVGIAYYGGTQQMFAVWGNRALSPPFNAMFSFFNGTSWSNPSPIDPTSSVNTSVNIVYDSVDQILVAAWVDEVTEFPTYSILTLAGASMNPPVWTPQATISTDSQVAQNISLAYNSQNDQIFATWKDSATGFPVFSIFEFQGSSVLPVAIFTGFQKRNQFLLQADPINFIFWQPTLFPGLAGYILYRNGVQIGTFGPNTTQFQEHNQPLGTVYTIVAFNTQGVQSSPVSVTIN